MIGNHRPALRAAIGLSPDGAPTVSPPPGPHRLHLLGVTGMAARSAGRETPTTPIRERKKGLLVEAAGAPLNRAHPKDVPPGPGQDDNRRFLVAVTTGYTNEHSPDPVTEWLVLDRLDAMRVVWRSHDIDETGREHARHQGDQESIARTIASRLERHAR